MRSPSFLPSASQRLSSIRIPGKAAMQILIILSLVSLCIFPNIAAAATQHIYDVPQAGPPGSQTHLVGNGWDPNATIDLYFDSTDVGLVDTDQNGTFGMALKAPTLRQNGFNIQIPNNAVPGAHWITAVERITQIQAQVQFTVSGLDWPQFQFDAQHTGFNPHENFLSPQNVGNLTIHWSYSTNAGSPGGLTVANGVLYAGDYIYGGLYAIDASTGGLRWKYPNGPVPDTSPAVANGVVYFGDYGYFYALNASTGALLWKDSLGASSTPTVANGVVYVAAGPVYAIDAGTGAVLWMYSTGGSAGTLAVANGVVYAGSYDHNVYALNAGTGALIWKYATAGHVGSGAAVANGIVYVGGGDGDNSVYALNAATGALIWKYLIGGPVYYSPAVANGIVYIGSHDNNLYALNASTGALLWKYTTGANVTSPAVANGVVYFANWAYDDSLYALDANTGTLLWKRYQQYGFSSGLAIVNGTVYANTTGWVYAFGLPQQQMSERLNPPQRPDPASLTPDWSLQPNSQFTQPLKK